MTNASDISPLSILVRVAPYDANGISAGCISWDGGESVSQSTVVKLSLISSVGYRYEPATLISTGDRLLIRSEVFGDQKQCAFTVTALIATENSISITPGYFYTFGGESWADGEVLVLTVVRQGGGAGASSTVSEVEIDFGSTPVDSAEFTIIDAAVSASSKVVVSESGSPATGREEGDALWDSIHFTAYPGSGQFKIFANCSTGPVEGKRKIIYQVF